MKGLSARKRLFLIFFFSSIISSIICCHVFFFGELFFSSTKRRKNEHNNHAHNIVYVCEREWVSECVWIDLIYGFEWHVVDSLAWMPCAFDIVYFIFFLRFFFSSSAAVRQYWLFIENEIAFMPVYVDNACVCMYLL